MSSKFLILFLCLTSYCASAQSSNQVQKLKSAYQVNKSNDEWKAELSPEAYYVLREAGTERAFTGELLDNHEDGTYSCAACSNALFKSDTKFKSGTGWPSFYAVYGKDSVLEINDSSYGWSRTEVLCAKCGGHLGHVFNDGPNPTGLRYCINSVALEFKNDKIHNTQFSNYSNR